MQAIGESRDYRPELSRMVQDVGFVERCRRRGVRVAGGGDHEAGRCPLTEEARVCTDGEVKALREHNKRIRFTSWVGYKLLGSFDGGVPNLGAQLKVCPLTGGRRDRELYRRRAYEKDTAFVEERHGRSGGWRRRRGA